MFLDNTSVLAKYWSNKISQSVKKSYEYKAKKGIPPARFPHGYLYDKEKQVHYKDPEYKEMMEFLFSTFDNEKISLAKLAEIMGENGYKTPKGKRWQVSNLHYVLTNPIYAGFFYYDDIEYEANHEPYCTKEVFSKRMERLNKKFNGTRKRNFDFIFSTFLRSGPTGKVLTGEIKKGKYIYYTNRRSDESFREELVIELISAEIEKINFSDDFAETLKQTFKKIVNEKLQDHSVVKKQITERINDLEVKQGKFLDLFAEEDIDKEVLKKKLYEIRNEINRLLNKQKKVNFNKDKFILDISEAVDNIRKFPSWYAQGENEKKADLLKSMAEYIEVFDDHVIIHWKDTYNLIIKKDILQVANTLSKVRSQQKMHASLERFRTIVQDIVDEYVFEVCV